MDEPHHCFECECGAKQTEVWNMVENVPTEKWADVRDLMIRPVLERVAELKPSILPLAWVTDLPTPMPEDLTRAQKGYYHACTIAQKGWGSRAPKNLVHLLWGVISALEESVEDLMMRADLQALSVQLLEFVGKDMIMEYIVQYLDDTVDFAPKTSSDEQELAFWLRMTGARDYGMELLAGFRKDLQRKVFVHEGRTRRGVQGYQLGLAAAISLEKAVAEDSPEKRDVATAMALHPRLGRGSTLGALPSEIIAKCVVYAYPEPLVRWRVVLGI